MSILSGLKDIFFDSFVRIKNGNDEKVTEQVYNSRMNICNACPKLLKTGNCGVCGCFVKAKTQYVDESCPINKW
jgi:hypothetical protein